MDLMLIKIHFLTLSDSDSEFENMILVRNILSTFYKEQVSILLLILSLSLIPLENFLTFP